MKGYRKILIAVNGSTDTLLQGLKLARDEKCWVTVVKVMPPYDGDLNLVGIRNIKDVLNGEEEKAVSKIEDVAASERTMVKVRIAEGTIHKKITEVAEEERCDLIIMGVNKKNGIKRFFDGNVARKVISYAPCPVLVVNT